MDVLTNSGLPTDGWGDDLFLDSTPTEMYYRDLNGNRTHKAVVTKIDWDPTVQRIRVYDIVDALSPVIDKWVGERL